MRAARTLRLFAGGNGPRLAWAAGLLALILLGTTPGDAFGAWLPGWSNRMTITVEEQFGDNFSDFQFRVDVPWDPAMNTDFSDLRFTGADEITLIDYWVEQYVPGVSAIIWVELPTLTAFTIHTVYLYFGNDSATSLSSGPDTWDFFDDFTVFSGWSDLRKGTVSQNTSTFGFPVLCKEDNNDPNGGYKSLGTTATAFRMLAREYRPSGTGGDAWNQYGLEDARGNGYLIRREADVTGSGDFGWERRVKNDVNSPKVTTLNQPHDTWYITQLTRGSKTPINITATLFDDAHNLIGSINANNNATKQFTRFTVRGGYRYYFDWIAVGKFAKVEPIVTLDPPGGFPALTLLKSSSVISDPANGMLNPKRIPGSVILYTVDVVNTGDGETDDSSLIFTDPLPPETALYVGDLAGAGPVSFVDTGPVPSGLAYTFLGLGNTGDDLEFSNNGGASFTYVPAPDAAGYDSSVTHVRVIPSGAFARSDGVNHPQVRLQFQIRVK